MMTLPRDNYDLATLRRRLAHSPFGRRIHYFDSTDSTNSFLCAVSPEQTAHGTVVLADHQRAGRGKYDRRWTDTAGRSLLFSVLLVVERPSEHWPLITLGAAVAVCRGLETSGVAHPRIRWPNDVLVGGKKLCGILTERGASESALVVGIGLNVHQSREDLPAELRDSATSLRMISPQDWKRADLLVAILGEFARVLAWWCDGQDDRILHECRRRMSTLGQPIRLTTHERVVEGVALDLDREGSLVVREPTGVLSQWHSADVEEQQWLS